MEYINVAEAKSRFSELISRAVSGERFIIRRRDRPVVALIGAAELERLERSSHAARRLALALGKAKSCSEGRARRAPSGYGGFRFVARRA